MCLSRVPLRGGDVIPLLQMRDRRRWEVTGLIYLSARAEAPSRSAETRAEVPNISCSASLSRRPWHKDLVTQVPRERGWGRERRWKSGDPGEPAPQRGAPHLTLRTQWGSRSFRGLQESGAGKSTPSVPPTLPASPFLCPSPQKPSSHPLLPRAPQYSGPPIGAVNLECSWVQIQVSVHM